MILLKINHFMGEFLGGFPVTVGDCKHLFRTLSQSVQLNLMVQTSVALAPAGQRLQSYQTVSWSLRICDSLFHLCDAKSTSCQEGVLSGFLEITRLHLWGFGSETNFSSVQPFLQFNFYPHLEMCSKCHWETCFLSHCYLIGHHYAN